MAVTITVEPTTEHKPAFNDILFTVTSDRDGVDSYTIVGVADNGGNVELIFPNDSFLLYAGDVVLLSTFTKITNDYYNVLSVDIPGESITIDLAWDTLFTGDTGVITLSNREFKIKASIYETSTSGTKIADIYINGVGSYSLTPNEVLKTILSYNFQLPTATVAADDNSTTLFQIRFTEVFNNASGLIITGAYADATVSLIDYIKRQQYETKALTEWMNYDLNTHKPLTNIPYNHLSMLNNAIPLYNGEYFQLGWMWQLSANATANVRVNLYDSAGSYISQLSLTSVTSGFRKLYQNIVNNATVRATATAKYIGCYLQDAGGTRVTRFVYFEIIREDVTSCFTRIHFVNKFGQVDAFTFKGFHETIDEVERLSYQKNLAGGYVTSDRGNTIYKVEAERTATVYSDYLSDDEALWLTELLQSEAIWIHKDSQMIPIDVLNNSMIIQSREGLQLKLEYKYSNKLI